jgi:hypothetical protein
MNKLTQLIRSLLRAGQSLIGKGIPGMEEMIVTGIVKDICTFRGNCTGHFFINCQLAQLEGGCKEPCGGIEI